MNIDGKNLAIGVLIARSQGATSVTPALVGSLMRYPMGLVFTILLAKREGQTVIDNSSSPTVQKTVPKLDGLSWDRAYHTAKDAGLSLTLGANGGSTKGVVVRQEPAAGKPQPANQAIEVTLADTK